MSLKIKSWKDVQAIVLSVAVIIIIIAMLMDFINYKEAAGLIKSKVPTSGPNAVYMAGGSRYVPFRWAGPLKGRIYLTFDENMKTPHKEVVGYPNVMGYGNFDGVLKGVSGVNFVLQKKSDFPTYYGETTVKRKDEKVDLKMWVYLLSTGKKTYKKVYQGQVPVDYPITRQIVAKYKNQIDTDRNMTEKDVEWLCSFTHDSLQNYVVSFFENNKTAELFTAPNIYAYRLEQIISSQIKWEKTYKMVWTGERKGACIGVIYKIDDETYVRVIYNAYWIHCHGGGFIWTFWH